jgi:hypothetical protein
MAKKLFIFLGAAAAAAVVTGVVASKRRSAGSSLADVAIGKAKGSEWRMNDDALSTEFAGVVTDEVAAAR